MVNWAQLVQRVQLVLEAVEVVVDQMVQQDLRERQVQQDLLEILVQPAQVEPQEHKVLRDQRVHRVRLEVSEILVQREVQVLQE